MGPPTTTPRVLARYAVPVGLGIFTWLLVLIAAGAVLSMDSVSVFSLVTLAALGLLFVPVYRFRPWRTGSSDRVLAFLSRRRRALAAAAGLFVLVRIPAVTDLFGSLLSVLLLPVRAVPQLLFGVSVFYGARAGEAVGGALFDVGRLYVEFLWLYAVVLFALSLVPGGKGSPEDDADGGEELS
ncbi:MAG: hypothetical protein ABEH56_01030 [Salinirussus sp.]